MSVTIEQDLKDYLDRFETKLNNLQKYIAGLTVSTARIEESQKSLSTQITALNKRVEKIESDQKTFVTDLADLKGTKSLIIPIIVAVITSLLTLLIRAIPNP